MSAQGAERQFQNIVEAILVSLVRLEDLRLEWKGKRITDESAQRGHLTKRGQMVLVVVRRCVSNTLAYVVVSVVLDDTSVVAVLRAEVVLERP